MKILRLFFVVGGLLLGYIPSISAADIESTTLQDPPVRMKPFYVSGIGDQIIVVGCKEGRLFVDPEKTTDYLYIKEVQKGTPADQAGLKPGMRILRVKGVLVTGLSFNEVKVRMDRVPDGNAIKIKVLEPGSIAPKELTVAVNRIPRDTVAMAR